MSTDTEIVSDIIRELTRVQGLATLPVDKDDVLPIPRMIAIDNERGIIVSKKIDQLISKISRLLHNRNSSIATSFTAAEWGAAVRNAFGPALAHVDLTDDVTANAKIVIAEVQRTVTKQAGSLGSRDYAFGCTLFSNKDIAGFNIGPVRFEPKGDWLARKAADGSVSAASHRRVRQAWGGKKLRKRKSNYDSIREEDILAAIGGCPYVCSVSTDGLGPEAGKEKALTAARLALTAIALLWTTPSSVLDGFNLAFDRMLRRQQVLAFAPGKILLSGSKLSHLPHGPYLKPGEWEALMKKQKVQFSVAADVIGYFLKPRGSVARPKMMSTLGQALLWFHEACREPVTLMAIVKFSASMDALASGRKAAGIRRLINARLGITDGDLVQPYGTSVKQVIDEIYSEGRSRTIHGTNDKLGYDWSVDRMLAEYFARVCMVSCMDWAGRNPAVDDPLQLAK